MNLFSIYQKEKNLRSIQKLDELFYRKVADQISRLNRIIEKVKEIDTEELKKLRIELENLKLLIRDIYDLREKKILELALITSRLKSESEDIDKLTIEEKVLYKILFNTLLAFRKYVLESVLSGEKPKLEELGKELNKILKASGLPKERNVKVVRIVKEISEFVGTDLQTYGPYKPEEIVTLPKDVAEMLINSGFAEEIRI